MSQKKRKTLFVKKDWKTAWDVANNLDANTTYYVQAFLLDKNQKLVKKTEFKKFTTLKNNQNPVGTNEEPVDEKIPEISNVEVKSMTTNSATISAEIITQNYE
jgi:hypothetical protein